MQTSVHRFVEDRRRDLGIREIGVHRKRQLHQTRTLLVEVRSPAREALHDDVCEISPEMPEVVGYVVLDEGETALQPRDDSVGVDVGTRVVHDYGNPEHVVPGGTARLAVSGEQPE